MARLGQAYINILRALKLSPFISQPRGKQNLFSLRRPLAGAALCQVQEALAMGCQLEEWRC